MPLIVKIKQINNKTKVKNNSNNNEGSQLIKFKWKEERKNEFLELQNDEMGKFLLIGFESACRDSLINRAVLNLEMYLKI